MEFFCSKQSKENLELRRKLFSSKQEGKIWKLHKVNIDLGILWWFERRGEGETLQEVKSWCSQKLGNFYSIRNYFKNLKNVSINFTSKLPLVSISIKFCELPVKSKHRNEPWDVLDFPRILFFFLKKDVRLALPLISQRKNFSVFSPDMLRSDEKEGTAASDSCS